MSEGEAASPVMQPSLKYAKVYRNIDVHSAAESRKPKCLRVSNTSNILYSSSVTAHPGMVISRIDAEDCNLNVQNLKDQHGHKVLDNSRQIKSSSTASNASVLCNYKKNNASIDKSVLSPSKNIKRRLNFDLYNSSLNSSLNSSAAGNVVISPDTKIYLSKSHSQRCSLSSVSSSVRRNLFGKEDENKNRKLIVDKSSTSSCNLSIVNNTKGVTLSLQKKFPGVSAESGSRANLLLNLAVSKYNMSTSGKNSDNLSLDRNSDIFNNSTKKHFTEYNQIVKTSSLCSSPVFSSVKRIKRKLTFEDNDCKPTTDSPLLNNLRISLNSSIQSENVTNNNFDGKNLENTESSSPIIAVKKKFRVNRVESKINAESMTGSSIDKKSNKFSTGILYRSSPFTIENGTAEFRKPKSRISVEKKTILNDSSESMTSSPVISRFKMTRCELQYSENGSTNSSNVKRLVENSKLRQSLRTKIQHLANYYPLPECGNQSKKNYNRIQSADRNVKKKICTNILQNPCCEYKSLNSAVDDTVLDNDSNTSPIIQPVKNLNNKKRKKLFNVQDETEFLLKIDSSRLKTDIVSTELLTSNNNYGSYSEEHPNTIKNLNSKTLKKLSSVQDEKEFLLKSDSSKSKTDIMRKGKLPFYNNNSYAEEHLIRFLNDCANITQEDLSLDNSLTDLNEGREFQDKKKFLIEDYSVPNSKSKCDNKPNQIGNRMSDKDYSNITQEDISLENSLTDLNEEREFQSKKEFLIEDYSVPNSQSECDNKPNQIENRVSDKDFIIEDTSDTSNIDIPYTKAPRNNIVFDSMDSLDESQNADNPINSNKQNVVITDSQFSNIIEDNNVISKRENENPVFQLISSNIKVQSMTTTTDINTDQQSSVWFSNSNSTPPKLVNTVCQEVELPTFDSNKKRKRKKNVSGSLVSRLNHIKNRESSSTRIWQYEMTKMNSNPQCDLSNIPGVFRITKHSRECSRVFLYCSPTDQDTPSTDYNFIVNKDLCLKQIPNSALIIVDPKDVPFSSFSTGSIIRIFPPWHLLNLSNLKVSVIFSVYKIQLVSDSKNNIQLHDEGIANQDDIIPWSKEMEKTCDLALSSDNRFFMETLLQLNTSADNVRTEDNSLQYCTDEMLTKSVFTINEVIVRSTFCPTEILQLRLQISFVHKINMENENSTIWILIALDDSEKLCCLFIKDISHWHHVLESFNTGNSFNFFGVMPWKTMFWKTDTDLEEWLTFLKCSRQNLSFLKTIESKYFHWFILSEKYGSISCS